jgi:hypothetical protein
MKEQKFNVNNLRVASPCPVGWETMKGDERTRHCDLCELNVYNISGMKPKEVEKLVTEREGRLCIRMYRRADGTVITKDCPVGLRAVRKRVTKIASASLATILGLFTVSYSQKEEKKSIDASKLKIIRTTNISNASSLGGTICDPNWAVVAGAKVDLIKDSHIMKSLQTDSNGWYEFTAVAEGIYSIEVTSSGFKTLRVKNLKIGTSESLRLNFELKIGSMGETVGFIVSPPEVSIDMDSTSVQTTINTRTFGRPD